MFYEAYFKSRFCQSEFLSDLPKKFAIITAFATTGETSTDEENEAADKSPEYELQEAGRWYRRLTGYSPETGRSESGCGKDCFLRSKTWMVSWSSISDIERLAWICFFRRENHDRFFSLD